jgi:hypothetical protein
MTVKYYDESGPMPEIEMCDNCFYINSADQSSCLHCGYLLPKGVRERQREIWVEIFNYRHAPAFRFTFRDHLKDCFGWLVYSRKKRFNKFAEAFLDALENEMPFLRGLLR